MSGSRTESDSLGAVEVPSEAYWGAQTERSRVNFPIGTQRMPMAVVRALAIIKKCGAGCHRDLGLLPAELAEAMQQAASAVIDGQLDDHFPLVVWQTGSGTQSNMNVNEVIANRANEILGHPLGSKAPVHPNDHVNMSQSSNDVFPTAMSIAIVSAVEADLLPALEALTQSWRDRAREFGAVVKVGRTHLMDATPLTVGCEFDAYVAQLEHAARAIRSTLAEVRALAIGGTAVGTGLNTPAGWDRAMVDAISTETGLSFTPLRSKLSGQAAHDAVVSWHGSVRVLAVCLMKIANDVRWLASGPRAGLAELRLPANEPGSSMMPGKVNPTQCEALLMVCVRVMGNDTTIGIAGAHGELQLNVFKPLIVAAALESVTLLADAMRSFEERLVRGLVVDRDRNRHYVEQSLMVVTALSPEIGYDRAAAAAKRALDTGKTLRDVAVSDMQLVSGEDYDRLVNDSSWSPPRQS